jgi:PAS domain S-box-containing protein
VVVGLADQIEHKIVRAVPDVVDVLLISLIVGETGRIESPWFLLYLFPVMSVSRYLGRPWSVGMAVFAACIYGVVIEQYFPWASTAFGLRALVLVGVAVTAASLARQRDDAEASLLKAIEKIDRQILNDADAPHVMHSILQSAMEITDSKMSAIALIDEDKVTAIYSAATSNSSLDDAASAHMLMTKHAYRLTEGFTARKESLSLPQRNIVIATVARLLWKNDPEYWAGRLVFLKVEDHSVGVLGVFSRRSVHYTENDNVRLSSMAPLVALVRKNARVYADLTARETESSERLKLLYEIAEQLKTEQGLDALFLNVVRMVSQRLRSEEAALFIPDERRERIVKRAVWGPDATTRKTLERIETSYGIGENSLTRHVFEGKYPDPDNRIAEDEMFAKEYASALPSQRTRDYLGAQLRIGSEVLGVIRVLNKKSKDYAVLSPALADEGFDSDDRSLLDVIATQVAAAIRSANFIEKNRYFKDLIAQSPDPIIVLDNHGRIKSFNKQAERIWNRSEAEVLNETVINFYPSEAEARRVGEALEAAPDHTISDFMTEIRDGKGNVVPIRLSAQMLIENGAHLGSIGLFKDQTERIRAAEEEKLAALGKLAQSFGHAIKNDLGAIGNNLDVLKSKAHDNPEILRTHSAIYQLTVSIRNKLQSMLTTAKPEPPRKEVLSIIAVLQDFETRVAHEAAATKIRYSSSHPDMNPLVYGQPSQLQQVLINLFANSVDAIKTARARGRRNAGQIVLAVATADDKIQISWRDDGVGMTDEVIRKAFVPFHTTKKLGNGLGLYMIRSIIQNHGGAVTVESEAPGVLFRITLPLAVRQNSDAEEATAS